MNFFRKLTLNDAMVKMYHDVLCTYIMNQKSANKLKILLDIINTIKILQKRNLLSILESKVLKNTLIKNPEIMIFRKCCLA